MLMELSARDPVVIRDLEAWRPVSYRQHFSNSSLRCAVSAIAGYDALDAMSRGAFVALCSAMDRLVETIILTFREIDDPTVALPIVDVAVTAFRSLLGRATAFVRSGGDMEFAAYDKLEVQQAIDAVLAS